MKQETLECGKESGVRQVETSRRWGAGMRQEKEGEGGNERRDTLEDEQEVQTKDRDMQRQRKKEKIKQNYHNKERGKR